MEVVQVIKRLNNTELGKAGTHDTYVLVPQNLDISDLFPMINEQIGFINKENGEVIEIRHTSGREKRIVGLGPFYAKYNVCAGDEIILERQIVYGESRYFINLKKRVNTIVFQRQKKGFEILTKDRMNLIGNEISVVSEKAEQRLQVKFVCSDKKRQDSPELTDFYDILIGENSLLKSFSGKEMLELEICDEKAYLKRFCAWKKYKFEMEDWNE